MTASPQEPHQPPDDFRRPPWWLRVHVFLMPDYNRPAAIYWWMVVALGALALGHAVWGLGQRTPEVWLHVLLGTAIAMAAGVFPVRIPQSKNSFAAGEIFIFLLLLMHGTPAATIAAAGEAVVGSWRTSKRWSSRIASPPMAALAMSVVGFGLELVLGAVGVRGNANAGWVIVSSMLFAVGYFVANTLLVTAVPRLKRREPLQWSDLIGVFGWVGIAYAGSAAVASLLYLVYRVSGIGVLMGMVPLLAMLLATLHYLFRQQEAAEEARRANAEAAEREAELAARHVRELEASERRFHSAFTHASIGMALLAFDGRVLQANPALRALLGRADQDLVGHPVQDFAMPDDRPALEDKLAAIHRELAEGFALEMRCRHLDGGEVWVAAHCSFFSEPGASTPCLILQVQDISARRKAEAGLHHLAFHDSLTGLPNRRRFHELLRQSVAAVQGPDADASEGFAVMFLDFDRFKLINDSLGHDAGDEFLIQVSRRIQDVLRPEDVVARLGGDEFAVLLRWRDREFQVVAMAERLMEALKQPFLVAGTELITSASIGITFSKFGYTSPEDVLRDADIAMYKAKGAGKARYALFDSSLHTEVANRLRLEGELRRAIDDGQLTVAYQPVYELAGGRLVGFEALVRWAHPFDGAIPPTAFLPIAEEAGLMVRVTDFVLHCAARQLHQWHELGAEFSQLTINVNVSGHDIAHPAFAARVSRAIIESGLQAKHLTLELTEHILMSRLEGALPGLGELRQLGVRLAVDDFGTGYSSLSHLATLPIDILKIDRSFVTGLEVGSKEAAVVRSIVLLGSSLGKEVVAEGIETDTQLEQLRSMGCTYGQGYLLSYPLPPDDVTALLEGSLVRTERRAERRSSETGMLLGDALASGDAALGGQLLH